MSIVSEITRIKENIANAYDEAEGRGAALPEVRNSANLAGTIATIGRTVNVTFKHSSGQVVLSKFVVYGNTVTPPIKNMQLLNKSFVGWKIGDILYKGDLADSEFYDEAGNALSDAIKALTVQEQNVIVVSYYTELEVFYRVEISGGTMKKADGTGLESGSSVKAGEVITLVAEIPEGMYFAGWYDEKNELQGQTSIFEYYINSNIKFEARFSEIEVKFEPRAFFYGDKLRINEEAGNYTVFMRYEIPERYELIERGVIIVTSGLEDMIDAEMVSLDTVNGTTIKKATCKVSIDTWNNTSKFPAASQNKHFRIYATVRDGEETRTVYSELISLYKKEEE